MDAENAKSTDEESLGKKESRPERLKMRLSMRTSESNKEESSVIRQPKGPEAQGVKGFGRTMSRKIESEPDSDEQNPEPESVDVRENASQDGSDPGADSPTPPSAAEIDFAAAQN